MPRIRYLKPDFFKDEDLATLPLETRLFFAGLWTLADKSGRLEDRPSRLKAELFPYDNIDAEQCLQLLNKEKGGSGRPFIQRYIVNDQHYIQIVCWEKHQKPHHTERNSTIPPPPHDHDQYDTNQNDTIQPLTEKGTENQLGASTELRNGDGTVKQTLKRKGRDAPTHFKDKRFGYIPDTKALLQKLK